MGQIILKDEAYAIVGAAFEAYNELGCGFLEAVYQEALAIELVHRGIPFTTEVALPVRYKGAVLKQSYRADIICYDRILVELKAVRQIGDEHRAQLLNYLHATRLPLGLLINFGHATDVQYERFLPRH